MRLREYLRNDFVIAELDATDVDGVVRAIAASADAAGIGSEAAIADKLFERERAHPTVIGSGLAIPHATVEGLAGPVIGIALTAEPIPYGPTGTEPVRAFFVLLSPPGSERLHVKLLARICRLVRQGDLIERLQGASGPEDAVGIVEDVDALHA